MSAPVTHVEILGPDRQALVAFYGEVFGWSFEPHDEQNYTMFRVSPGGIGGGIGTTEDKTTSVSVYAEVADLDETLARAKDLGALDTTGPIDIGGGGRIGTVKDPGGNVFGLYAGPTGDQPAGTGAPVSWFDIIGKDGEALAAFYSALLGWEIDRGEDGYAHVRPVKDGIGGGISTSSRGLPDHALYAYVNSDDLEATLQRIIDAGGKQVMGRMNVSERLDIALFEDPAGNLNGLVQYGAGFAK